MHSDHHDDPYAAPRGIPAELSRGPGAVGILFIAVVTVVAAFCAFFGSCVGFVMLVLLVPTPLGGLGWVVLFLSLISSALAAVFTAEWIRPKLTTLLTLKDEEVQND